MPETELILSGNITAELRRKPIRHIYIRIYPPDGRIVVSAPTRMSGKAITDFLSSKSNWIAKQLDKMKASPQEKPKSYTDGEYHYYAGKKHVLYIVENRSGSGVYLSDNKIIMNIGQGLDRDGREKLLYDWYRQKLSNKLPGLLEKWELIMGLKVSEIRFRKMKTRWGTCNTSERRIWISLELAKYHDSILEYILVHEMTHLLERKHNKRFYSLMDNFLPDWRERKKSMY